VLAALLDLGLFLGMVVILDLDAFDRFLVEVRQS